MAKTRNRKVKAWLVTWEWSGDHAKPSEKVVEILDPRLPPERVRQIVELLYHRNASLSEKVAWRLLKRNQPYRAEFIKLEGLPYEGEIICGHNPWLRARLVDDLEIVRKQDGVETATWKDRYDLREMRKKIAGLKKAGVTLAAGTTRIPG